MVRLSFFPNNPFCFLIMRLPLKKIYGVVMVMGIGIIAATIAPSFSFAQTEESSTENTEDQGLSLGQLMVQLFQNPADLELNFKVMQAQIAEGNLEGAEATLERVLFIDPESTIARVLLADIQIQLGKFISAKRILDDLIQDEDTPDQTRQRAEGLAQQIEEGLDTTVISGGYSFYAGQTENAFGRSKDDEILLLNLPLENTTKDKSDQFYGYRAYLSIAEELDYQTPTQISAGISFSGRDTHDPARSDVESLSVNFSLLRADDYRLNIGGFGSYTDVGKQDFNKSLGLFAGITKPFLDGAALNATFSAARNIYFPFEGVANNDGKSNRSFTLRSDITQSTRFGFAKLGLIGGINNAQDRVHDFQFEKVELVGYAANDYVSVNTSLSRQWTRYDIADTFISSERQKTTINELALNFRYLDVVDIYGVSHVPYINLSVSDTESNIPNYRRDGAEFSIGVEASF